MLKKVINEKDVKLFHKSVTDAKSILKKGNMIILAIGLLLGTVFNAVISSLANDVIMGAITHQMNLSSLDDLKSAGVLYGKFLGRIIQFIVVTFSMFVLLIGYYIIINYKKQSQPIEPPKPPAPTTEQLILAELKEISTALKNDKKTEIQIYNQKHLNSD